MTTQVSSEQRMEPEKKKNLLVLRVPRGLKYLLIQTGHKLRNHYRAAKAILADLQGCPVAKFLSSPKRCMIYPCT